MNDILDVSAWLRSLGLERYEAAFRDNQVGAEVLPRLTAEDLTALGVTAVGHRRKLLDAIAALRGETPRASERSAGTGLQPAAASSAPVRESSAERRQLTVMFCDLVGSTELAARLDPEDLREVISAYHRRVAEVVERFDGHVAKYMGDGVLAYFGYPRAHEDAAERAVRAGLDLVEAIGALGRDHHHGAAPLRVRVGIATGLVVVGDLIGEGAARGEVVGETPNLAARLQALAEPGTVVIGLNTRRLVGGLFECADLGAHALKGLAEPVQAWRVLGPGRAEGRFEARQQAAAGLTPLVGRAQELALLLERWQRAKDGEGQVVLLQGEPGIGKSRLVQALRERLADEPHARLSYQCSPYHTTSPLHPVIEHLERTAGFQRDDPAEARLAKLETLLQQAGTDLSEAAPLLAALLSIPTGDRYPPLDLTPQRQRAKTLEALLDQLAGLATKRPVLVILEDAHWSDPTTRELFDLTVERVRDLPVLVVITHRPEFQPPWTGHGHVTALNLNRLSRRQVTAMIEQVSDKVLPAEVVSHIVTKTDGVPLFIEELTKTVLETGLVHDAGNRYELTGPLPALAIPSTLHDSLLARLDRLAPVREVAQVGAALGREFSYELLAAVAPLGDNELRDALGQLCAAELVFCRGAPPQASYSFKHALVQDAAYGTLLRSRRRQLHGRIARVLEERFPGVAEAEPEVLAHHCARAGLAEKAAAYWHKAGQRALARSATAEAVAQLTRGLEVLKDLPGGPERDRLELDLQAALGGAQLAAKGWAAAETGRAYARTRELSERLGETGQLFPALWGLTVFHINRGQPGVGRQFAEEMLRLAERQEDTALRVASHRALSAALFHLGKLVATRAHLERVLALYETLPDRPLPSLYTVDHRVMALSFLSRTLLALGYPDQARARSREALAYARELAHPHSLAFALDQGSQFHCTTCEWEAVHAQAQALVTLSTGQDFSDGLAMGIIHRGCALAALGRIQEGIALFREGLAARAAGHKVSPLYLGVLAEAHRKLGRPEEALRLLAEALERVERTDERWCEAELRRLKGEVLVTLSGRDRTEAEGCFQRALAVAREQSARMWELRAATSLARLWRDQGRCTDARDLLAPIYGWFTEGFDTHDLQDAKALLDGLRSVGGSQLGLAPAHEIDTVALGSTVHPQADG